MDDNVYGDTVFSWTRYRYHITILHKVSKVSKRTWIYSTLSLGNH